MSRQKQKYCLFCSQPFVGRRDAKTCSARCRKRMQLVRLEMFGPEMAAAAAEGREVKVAAAAADRATIAAPAPGSARRGRAYGKLLSILLLVFGVGLSLLFASSPPKAQAASANNTLNFQARLLNAAGAVVPDGTYNIDFKIYNVSNGDSGQGSCSGSCLWEETWTGANKVTVTNGYFSVQLNSVNNNWQNVTNWDQPLYLTMDIGGTGTPSWDGEMQNGGVDIPLTGVPLAFQANSLSNVVSTYQQNLQFASSFTQATTITLPDPGASTATVCYQNSAACGFALSSGSGSYIQNSTGGPQSANFNIISAAAGNIGAVVHANASQSVDIFDVQSSASTVYFGVNSTGTQISLGATNPTIAATASNSSLSLDSNGTGAVNLDSGTTGNVNVGTNANAKTITIGNGTGTTSVVINDGTGALNIGTNGVAHTVTIGNSTGATSVAVNCGTGACGFGNNAVAHATTIGSTTGVATTTLQGGTGGVNLGTGGIANTIQIGNTTGAVTQTINIGTNATASSTSNVVIGSTIAGTVQLQPAGGVLLGKASSVNGTLVFQNSAGTNTVTLAAQAVNPASSVSILLPTVGGSGAQCLQSTSGSTTTNTTLQFGSCGGGGISTVGTFDSQTASSNGAVISGSNIYFQSASTTNPGMVNTSSAGQTFAGPKAIQTTGGNTISAFQVQNAIGADVFDVDTTGVATNLVTNGSFETNPLANWVYSGTPGSVTRDSGTYDFGLASLKVVTASGSATTGIGDSAKQTLSTTLTASTQYSLTFYALASGSTMSDLVAAYSYDGANTSGHVTLCTPSDQTTATSGWKTYTCNFTTGSGGTAPTASNAIFIGAGSAETRTFWLDGVELLPVPSNYINTYTEGALHLNGFIASPVAIQPAIDSNRLFSVYKANGTALLSIDSQSNSISLGATGGAANSYITIGSPSNNSSTTIKAGTGGINLSPNGSSNTGVVVRPSNESAGLFQIQDADGVNVLNIDTTPNPYAFLVNNSVSFSGNLLQNPGFESGNTSNDSSGWVNPNTSLNIVNNSAVAHSGNRYLSLAANSTNQNVTALQPYSVNPGEQYYLEGWVNTAAGTNGTGGFYLDWLDKNFAHLSFSNGTWNLPSSWTLNSMTATAPAGAKYVLVNLTVRSGSTTGTWYFDDIYFNRMTQQAPQVFENSANSTTALQIQNSSTNTLLNADTTNMRISVGSEGTATGQLYVSGSVPSAALSTTSANLDGTSGGMAIQGRYAYVTNYNDTALMVYNVSNPASPVLVNGTGTATDSSPISVKVEGHYAYVLDRPNGKLQVFDISNPASPVSVGITQVTTSTYSLVALQVEGRYAYVDSFNDHKIFIVDISNPSLPVVTSTITTTYTGPTALVVDGGYAYVGDNSGALEIYNVSNPASPSLAYHATGLFGGIVCSASGDYTDYMYKQNNYLFLSVCNDSHIKIFDVSNPTSPTVADTLTAGSGPTGVYAQGRYLYAVDFTNKLLETYDISNISSPVLVGSVATDAAEDGPSGVVVSGRYAYVTNDKTAGGSGSFQIFDLGGAYVQQLEAGGTETGTLQVDSNAQVAGDMNIQGGTTIGQSLAVNGDADVGGSLAVQKAVSVNVSYSPMSAPTGVTATTQPTGPTPSVTPTGGSSNGKTWGYEVVAYKNGILWSVASAQGTNAANGYTTLTSSAYNALSWSAVSGATSYQIYRTSVPSGGSPSSTGLIGSTTTTGFNDKAYAGNGQTAPGNGLVLTASTTYYYKVTAIDGTGGETTASSEVNASSGTTRRVDLSWTAVPGAAGYRIYQSTATGTETYVDTTSTNAYVDGYFTNKNPGTTSPPTSNTAYAATNNGNSALQISIGGNGQPTGQLYVSGTVPTAAVGTFNFNNTVANDAAPYWVVAQGKYTYTINHGGNLVVFDTSNPQNPQRIGHVGVSNAPSGLAVSGRYAYALSGLSGCSAATCQLTIIDVSNPANPTVVSQVDTGASTFPVAGYIQGRYLYVAYNGTNQLGIWDVSNPVDPINVDTVTLQHSGANDVFVEGRYAYVADNSDWLEAVDVSNPAGATTISGSAVLTNGGAKSVYVQGNYAYVADGDVNGLDIFNIADVTSPKQVSSVASGSGTTGPISVFVQGRYAYVGNYNGASIGVIDVGQPSAPALIGTMPAANSVTNIYVQGRYLYAVSDSANALQVFDIGGTYTQQLEAGGAELGTLNVDSNSMFGGDVNIQGGTTIGQSLAVGGDLSVDGSNISLASGNNANTVQIANDQISTGTFPSTPVLDNFNRADGAPGSNWYTIDPGYQLPNITSDQLQQISTGEWPDGYWTTKFRPDQEVYTELNGYPSSDQSVLMLRLSGVPSQSENGYEARFNGTTVLINRVTSANRTLLGTFSMSGQDWVGFRALGSTLTAYVSSDGITWTSVGSVTDSTYDNSGYIGFFSNDGSGVLHTYDNFGGGAIPTNDGNNQTVSIGSTGGASSLLLQSGSGNTVLSSSGSVIVKPYNESTTAFQVQNTSGSAILNADTVNTEITFSNNAGDLTAWQNSANPLPATVSSNPAVVANGYMYIIGGSGATRNISYAKLNGDGTNGAWTTQTNILPVASKYAGAVSYNGYLYIIGGYNGSADVSTVYYAKLNPFDGSVGALNTTTALPDTLSAPGVVETNGYVYVLGGSDGSPTTAVYYAKLNSDGTVGAWQTGTSLSGLYASGLKAESVVAANGNIYLFGGSNGSYVSQVSYISVNSDGSMGASWTASGSMPGTKGYAPAVLVNGYVYVVGGYGGDGAVYYAPLSNNGTIGTWNTASYVLPNAVAEAPVVTSNGYIYDLGGYNSSAGGLQSVVQYASTARVLVGGSLDLVGLSGATLNDAGQTGGTGGLAGSLTAGNTQIVGSLQVQGATTIGQGLAVNGNALVGGQLIVPGTTPSTATGTTLTGDAPQGLVVQGNFAYTVSNLGNDLEVYDVSNPSNPFEVMTVTTGTSSAPYDLAVAGQYAYVVDYGTSDLQIFDISNPDAPVSVGKIDTGTNPDSVYVQGRYAYVVTYTSETLEVYDISNPANPVRVSSQDCTSEPWSIFVQGHYAYIGGNAEGNIQTFDVSDPSNPVQLDSQGVNGTGHMQVYVQGGYTYTVNNGVSTMDIYNTTDPTLLSSPIGTVDIGTGGGPGIYVQGHYAYVSNDNGTILVIDVSNKSSPTVVGTIANTATSGNTAVYVNGRYLYEVGYDGSDGHMWVYDMGGAYIQQLESGGTETGTLQVNSNGQFGGDVSIQGGTTIGQSLAVGGNVSVAGQLMVNGSLPTSALASISVASSSQISVQNGYAFINNGSGNGYTIADINNPASPSVITTTSTPTSISKTVVQGRYAYSITTGTTFQVDDISNPHSVTTVGTATIDTHANDVVVSGRYAYVATLSTSNGLAIIDISNPANPVQVGHITGLQSEYAVYVQGDYAYLVGGSGKLNIINISDPTNPVTVNGAGAPIGSVGHGIVVRGSYAYALDRTGNELYIFNVSDPTTTAAAVGTITTNISTPEHLAIQGNYAYVTDDGSDNVSVYDISDPTNPVAVGTIPIGGSPWDLNIQGRYMYVTDTTNHLLDVFDLGGGYIQQLESGGLATTTLQVSTNGQFNGDVDIQGALAVGQSLLVNGNIGVGGNLQIGAGSTGDTIGELIILDTDTNSTFRGGTSSSAPTAASGAMFYSSSDNTFMCGVDGAWQTCSGILGSNTGASTAVKSCTNTCASFDNGRFTIPANYLQPGKVIHLVAKGVWSDTGTPNFGLWGVYFGSNATTKTSDTLIAGTAFNGMTLGSTQSNKQWYVDFTIVCYTSGSSGTVSGSGTLTYDASTGGTSDTPETIQAMNTSGTVAMNTTTAQTIYLFPSWTVSSASNSVTAQQFYLKVE